MGYGLGRDSERRNCGPEGLAGAAFDESYLSIEFVGHREPFFHFCFEGDQQNPIVNDFPLFIDELIERGLALRWRRNRVEPRECSP